MSKFERISKMVLLVAVGFFLSSLGIKVFNVMHLEDNHFTPSFQRDVKLQPKDEDAQTLPKPETMLVILTYMRSGSTFTGDLIQRSPDVFYVFEPLWSLQHLQAENLKPIYIEKSGIPSDKVSRETLENFLSCNMKDVDIFSLKQYHMSNSLTTYPYFGCVTKKHGVVGVLDCLPSLEQPCRESRVSSVKTIRFTMKDMTYLMDKHSQMKIIHLIRDPRATLRSQRNVGEFIWKNLNSSATKLCERIDKDLQSSAEMKSKYPGRIATLRYEDLAEDPYVILEKIYSFLGLDLTAKIKEYVHNATTAKSDQPNCGALCTRKNTTAVISKWRQTLPFEHVTKIDSICKTVYQKVGYIPVKDDASLKNIMIPVHSVPPQGVTFRH